MEWANPAEKRACENSSTVPNRQLTGSSRRSPHPESQLQGVQFPYWGSSRLEDGLSNLSWETRGYELCPLGSHTHSFHNSERGWKIMPAASERRSLLTGIPHGEPCNAVYPALPQRGLPSPVLGRGIRTTSEASYWKRRSSDLRHLLGRLRNQSLLRQIPMRHAWQGLPHHQMTY